ncbi:3'-5' exonuclease [Sphingomicrobium sp. XHP0239]|uniref:3'-5' exonuclease n=1 Tax=Sphingomicrobium maritimum TaxID=3133972 RepID=UPI0031CCB95A
MTLLYSSTFADALGKLSHQEQKQVKITTFDLMTDPKGGGLSLERIKRAGDDNLWSARVSRDLRIILRRDGEDNLLAYVGHHDDAYRWAERRKIVPHERTGAMQIVQLVERTENPTSVADQPVASPEFATEQPFWALSDDQLLDVGVPRDWLEAVRAMAAAEVDGLFDRLPAEAAEALYDFATGGKLEDHVVEPVDAGENPFAHPDAQRRFRVLDNIEELQAALDAPFEKWAVFLHPAQRDLVSRPVTGPTRVTGSAGTGKTIVALHRAVHLAEANSDARVLVTTFTKDLAASLSTKLDLLTQSRTAVRERMTVRTLDQAASELYTGLCGHPNRATPSQIRAMIGAAKDAGLGGGLTETFLLEEWTELVDAWGVVDEESYAVIPRVGRRTRLGAAQREAAWGVFDYVRECLRKRNLVTNAMIFGRVTEWIKGGGRLPFDHVVVDEAQDLTVAQVRFLAQAGQDLGDALFLAGDIGQRIFRLPFSWAKLGLDIRGRSHSLKVNYRTSHQIRAMADRLLPPSITDMDGVEEGRRGTMSVFDGPEPDIRLFDGVEDEALAVGSFLKACVRDDIAPSDIAILVRSRDQFDRARAAAKEAGFNGYDDGGVRVVTMHEAKGREFPAVAVMACDEDVIPDPSRFDAIGDVGELEAAFETERHLLYVACTRARDQLLVTGVAPGSEFLDDLRSFR